MTVVRALCYGYLGAILGGLGVAIATAPFAVSVEAAAGAAATSGAVLGTLGLALPLRQAAVARIRARRASR